MVLLMLVGCQVVSHFLRQLRKYENPFGQTMEDPIHGSEGMGKSTHGHCVMVSVRVPQGTTPREPHKGAFRGPYQNHLITTLMSV